jgi:hypothetical protein
MAMRDPYSTPGSAGGRSPTEASSAEPGVAAQAQERLGQVADQAQDRVGQVADQAQEQVGHFVDRAQEQAKSQLGGQMNRAAEGLGSVAEAVGAVGQQLHEKDQAALAQYAYQAADQIERFSHYLQERDVDQLLGEAQRLARRQPTLFLGGAFALGLLAARFLKSSSERTRGYDDYYGGYDSYTDRSRYMTSPYGYNYPTGMGARPAGQSATAGVGSRVGGMGTTSSQGMASGTRTGVSGTTMPAGNPAPTRPSTPPSSPVTSSPASGASAGTGSTTGGSTQAVRTPSSGTGLGTSGTPSQGAGQPPSSASPTTGTTQRDSSVAGSQSTTERSRPGEDR